MGKELPTTAGERTGDNQRGTGSCVRDVGGGVWGNRRRHCVTVVVVGLNKAAHNWAQSGQNRANRGPTKGVRQRCKEERRRRRWSAEREATVAAPGLRRPATVCRLRARWGAKKRRRGRGRG